MRDVRLNCFFLHSYLLMNKEMLMKANQNYPKDQKEKNPIKNPKQPNLV